MMLGHTIIQRIFKTGQVGPFWAVVVVCASLTLTTSCNKKNNTAPDSNTSYVNPNDIRNGVVGNYHGVTRTVVHTYNSSTGVTSVDTTYSTPENITIAADGMYPSRRIYYGGSYMELYVDQTGKYQYGTGDGYRDLEFRNDSVFISTSNVSLSWQQFYYTFLGKKIN